LERLGISFDRNGVLSVANSAKLTEALRDYPSRVSALFNSGASSLTASGTFGNTYITATSVSNLAVGQVLTATGIPSGAKVGAINSSTLQVDLVDDSGNPVSLTGDLSAAKVYLPVENQGLSVRLNGLISNLLDTSSSTPGLFATSTSAITNEKKMLQRQIELMDRQLAARQAALERSFVAMEKAQSKSQSMLSQLTNAFQKPS
jgi:flagellar capping protein FliD